MSSGRWYQLESGYQKIGGHEIPVGTTATTVAAAAAAIGWDTREALAIAGFDPVDIPDEVAPIQRFSDDELLAELKRRLSGVVAGWGPDDPQGGPHRSSWFPGEEAGVLRDQHRQKRHQGSG